MAEEQAADERDLSLLSSDSATRASMAAATHDATSAGWRACLVEEEEEEEEKRGKETNE